MATKKPAIKCFIFIIHFPGFGKKFMSRGEIINIIYGAENPTPIKVKISKIVKKS